MPPNCASWLLSVYGELRPSPPPLPLFSDPALLSNAILTAFLDKPAGQKDSSRPFHLQGPQPYLSWILLLPRWLQAPTQPATPACRLQPSVSTGAFAANIPGAALLG